MSVLKFNKRWISGKLIAAIAIGYITLMHQALTFGQNSPSTGQETMVHDSPHSTPISLVTYNAHLLPNIASKLAGQRGQSSYRSTEIGRRLADTDIIGLCETFDKTQRKQLLESLNPNSESKLQHLHGPSRSGRHLINGGLLLVTRFPILESQTYTFRHASRPLTHGWKSDGYAAKGILYGQIAIRPNVTLDCFLTHLESQNVDQRNGQVIELCDFVTQHTSSDRPAVLMGDLNISAGTNEYERLLEKLSQRGFQVEDTLSEFKGGTSDALNVDSGHRIDYVLWLWPKDSQRSHRTVNSSVDAMLDSHVSEGSLSDHAAVATSFLMTDRSSAENGKSELHEAPQN